MSDIIINNSKVVITNTNLPPMQKHFKRCFRFGKLRFYVTWNYRLKNSQSRDANKDTRHKTVLLKREKWGSETSEHKCERCGKTLTKYHLAELHHILPWWRFRDFELDIRNTLLLCHDCHKEIHKNPFLDCKMQEEKAKEFGINLKDYYEVV